MNIRQLLIPFSVNFLSWPLSSQPFVDLIQVRYSYGFRNPNASATPFTHLWAGSDIPIKLKENTYILLSPTYDRWQIDSADVREKVPDVQSFAFPVGLSLPLGSSKWALTMIAIPRWNGEVLFADHTFQMGGAMLASYARKPKQKFRLGIYTNAEFFGLFMVPLVGVDWQINEKNYLFGNLPGRLTFEHKWSDAWYGGFTFRAPTNSYRLMNGEYVRLDDNQLSAYIDFYLTHNICLTVEPGYGVFRQIRTGIHNRDYIRDYKWGDGPFLRLSSSYRIRF